MPAAYEIADAMKCAAAHRDLFYFTFCRQGRIFHNPKDYFILRSNISLYWLELFVKSDILDREVAVGLYNQCGTIRRLLIASINTAKENVK